MFVWMADSELVTRSIEDAKAFVRLTAVGGSGIKVKPNDFHPNVPSKDDQTNRQVAQRAGPVRCGFRPSEYAEVRGLVLNTLRTIKQIMDVDHRRGRLLELESSQDLKGQGLIQLQSFKEAPRGHGPRASTKRSSLSVSAAVRVVGRFSNYDGWILLECLGQPKDRVAAMMSDALCLKPCWRGENGCRKRAVTR